MPDLRRYREKREPGTTPEPFGEEERLRRPLPAGAARTFVVQQHAATRMHWDLRLEIGGVMVSWAIPRGPSLDPNERRLAVQTEDHPMEYSTFEGVIPEGNYGAGAMIVWDYGAYHTADGLSPDESLTKGKLDLVLNGHKLRGRFALVKTRGGGEADPEKSWLFISKSEPREDGLELVDAEPHSVFSGLRVGDLRDGVSREEALGERAVELGAPRRALDLKKLRPMLAQTAEGPFSRPGWIFELKHDGMRVLASRDPERGVRLYTRRGRDVTLGYPELTTALALVPAEHFVLDGEVVALDDRGKSSFERLQRRFSQTDPDAIERARVEVPTALYAFDLLSVAGHDLRSLPLLRRKELLAGLVPALGQVRFADHVEEQGEALFEGAQEHDYEGVMAKRADSKYEAGRRSPSWQKVRVPHAALLAIVGWEEGRGARGRLGSLKLAWLAGTGEARRLTFAGNAGSGLDDATIDAVLPLLEESETPVPPFAGAAESRPRGAHYVEPKLIARVRYTEVTSAGSLRHPVFLGLVEDASLDDCVAPVDREEAVDAAPAPTPKPAPTLQITRREKVFWPGEGITKGDLLDFYEAAWPWIEPYLRDRPVVLTRYPDGIEGKSFFQQNAPDWTPEWATHEEIDGTDFFICNEKRTLLHVINSGAIPLHVWSSRTTTIEHPDWIILDLDPKAAPFSDVVTLARRAHAILEEIGAPHYVKTSGQAGLHVLLPIGAQLDHDGARGLAEVLARVVHADLPEISTLARPIAARGDKVYLDYLQNGRGKLIVAPFSVRPKPGAPVSTPLTWSQVTARLDPAKWNIQTTLRRMEQKGDPMAGILEVEPDVAGLLDALAARL